MSQILPLISIFITLEIIQQTQAQVTIGSTKPPVQGALLMLDEGTDNDGVNATKGLLLSRVELQAYEN